METPVTALQLGSVTRYLHVTNETRRLNSLLLTGISTLKSLFGISLEEANQSQKRIFQSLPAWSDLTFLTQRTHQYIYLHQLEVSRLLLGLRNDGF